MPSENSSQKIYRMLDSDSTAATVCSLCFGTGMEVIAGKGARPCSQCRPTNTNLLWESARIPPRFRDCTFHNYYPKNDSQYWAHHFSMKLVDEYPGIDTGLLLMGSVGVGKTHLAIAILRGLTEKGVTCVFSEFGSLLKQIQDSYNPISRTSEMRVLAPIFQAEVLVLDELGASIPTDWVRDTMYQIINTRYNDKKLTIFTTNFLDERPMAPESRAHEAYEESRSSRNRSSKKTDREGATRAYTLDERIGVPLRSRLYEMCRKIVIEGEDYRKRRQATV